MPKVKQAAQQVAEEGGAVEGAAVEGAASEARGRRGHEQADGSARKASASRASGPSTAKKAPAAHGAAKRPGSPGPEGAQAANAGTAHGAVSTSHAGSGAVSTSEAKPPKKLTAGAEGADAAQEPHSQGASLAVLRDGARGASVEGSLPEGTDLDGHGGEGHGGEGHGGEVVDKGATELFLLHQRELLLAERNNYTRQAQELKAEADALALEHEPGDVQFDEEGGEGGTANVDRELDLHLSAQAQAAIEEIDLALAKIEAGTYGRCENCGSEIPKARLEALPHARLCVSCKSGGLAARRQ